MKKGKHIISRSCNSIFCLHFDVLDAFNPMRPFRLISLSPQPLSYINHPPEFSTSSFLRIGCIINTRINSLLVP